MTTSKQATKDDYIRVRINGQLKKEASEIIESMQLDMSTVINMTLDQIVRHNGLPFEVTNDDEETIQLKKLQSEVAKGLASFNQEKTYDIDEVKALFAKSGE
ncbi:type II toxin-antitoxin system RelB/DinJ family antitoxin [Enterococcus sp. 669A]|uniref:Type II toxin-antitoxin system RelB/DinJ family antitoxin n=1 Tax=Candidatus Enterococcus moelleringii TaxID=2815325 RepID=A0ABS3LG82_9ENTE|nr:type II toxin-antitoxin system RelB/DinJ family antitoxin [Enterococcus sp. 669A]MBO1308085.1 type II toxin-antitoxin system RelB/DinJ family antitoxin [Enterococcus sp. 669A]